MTHLSYPVRFAALLALAGVVTAGCQKATTASGNSSRSAAGSNTKASLGGAPAGEDPEVVDYAKKKGWGLHNDQRISDGKPVVLLSVKASGDASKGGGLTDDDCKMIVRSKTAQMIDLRDANCTDDGLKVIAGAPVVDTIFVGGENVTDAGVKSLAGCKSLEAIGLMQTKKVTDAGIKELAALPKLRTIYCFGLTLTGTGFAAFKGSPTLESVVLEYVTGLTDDGVKNFADMPNLNELKIGNGYTAAPIKAIVAKRVPAKFEFDKSLIDDDLLQSLVAKGWLYGPGPADTRNPKPATAGDVKSVVLSRCKVTDKGVQSVLDCTNATSLFLDDTLVTDETLKKLPPFAHLDYLALDGTKVNGSGLESLVGLPIKHVSLKGCELNESAFKALGKMAGLEELWLSRAKLNEEWLKHLGSLTKLKDLNLDSVKLTDAAAKDLAALKSLTSLNVNYTALGDAGFKEVLTLPNLKSIYVDGSKVTKDVYQKAKKEHPNMSFFYYRYDQ